MSPQTNHSRGWLSTTRTRLSPLRGLFAILLATTAIWTADELGVTDLLNGWTGDFIVRTTAATRQDRARVLLVYADRADLTNQPETLQRLLGELNRLKARAVGCMFRPDEVGYSLTGLAERTHWLYWVPRTAEDARHGTGLIELLPTRDGISRDHYAKCRVGEQEFRSLEGAIAADILLDESDIPPGIFGVNFRGSRDSLPSCRATDVLDGHLVSNLVEGKTVLIGFRPDAWSPGVMTPTTRGSHMSRLEFHGHVLHSLLSENTLRDLSPAGSYLMFLVAALSGYAVFRKMDLRWTAVLTASAVIASWCCTWLLMWAFRVRIPYASLLSVHALCLLSICDHRFRISRATLHRLLSQHRVKSRVLRSPTNFAASKDPWSDVTGLIYQMFYLNRLVVFDLQPGDQHVRPVKAVNCELDEMVERRRDYRRPPFADAMEAKAPVRVDTRDFRFFRRHRDDETQFLAAAMHQGQLMGFLAIDITTDSLETFQDFDSCLQRMSDEVGSLLAHWRATQRAQSRYPWLSLLTEVPEQPLVGELDQTNRAVERRVACLESVFESSTAASAIYDLFGQTLMMNRAMFQLMQDRGTVPAEMTAVELLGALSGRDWNQCRRLVRSVVMEHHTETVEIPARDDQGSSVLFIRPLLANTPDDRSARDVIEAFQVQGIHFELVDSSVVSGQHRVKDRITTRMVDTLSDQLEDVRSYVAQLCDPRMASSNRGKVAAVATNEIIAALDTLHDCQSFLNNSTSSNPSDQVPVQIPQVLEQVAMLYRDKADPRGIRLQTHWPEHLDDVMANPQLLYRVFEIIVELLLSNARNYSCITIRVEDAVSQARITFENEGFGTSTDRIQSALSDQYNNSLDEFRRLKDLRDWIEQWGGHMTVTSEVGTGLVVTLALQKYDWGLATSTAIRANADDETPGISHTMN